MMLLPFKYSSLVALTAISKPIGYLCASMRCTDRQGRRRGLHWQEAHHQTVRSRLPDRQGRRRGPDWQEAHHQTVRSRPT
jgi:hypothetical protein